MQLLGIRSPAGDDHTHIWNPLFDYRERLEQHLDPFLPHQPSDKKKNLLLRRGKPLPHRRIGAGNLECRRADPVGNNRYLIRGQIENAFNLFTHIAAVADHPPGLIGQGPLHLTDIALLIIMQAVVAPEFSRMNRGDQGHLKNMLNPPAGISHQPIMRVYQVKTAPLAEADPLLQHGQVQLVHPGEKV